MAQRALMNLEPQEGEEAYRAADGVRGAPSDQGAFPSPPAPSSWSRRWDAKGWQGIPAYSLPSFMSSTKAHMY